MHEQSKANSLSTDIINSLAKILRLAELHNVSNTAVINQMEKIVSYINEAVDYKDSLRIDLIGDFFFENNARVQYPLKYHIHFDALMTKFKQRNLGTVIFKDKISLVDMESFIKAFVASGNSDNPFEFIHDTVSGLAGLEVEILKTGRVETAAQENIRRLIKNTYFSAVSLSKGVMDKIKAKETVNMKKTKRVVQTLVDFISKEEQFLLSMTAIRNYDDYTYHHSVNVSILALALGQRIGLSKNELTELGIVAFFHDMGKVDVPNDTLNKSTSLSDEEFAIIREHSISGVKKLLMLKTLDPLIIRSAITAFEHHLNCDCSGYPRVRMDFEQDIYSKIVSIADRYDAMTSSRVYRRTALAPDTAVSKLIEDSGLKIDSVLLNFFILMIGVFPIGTLVLLDTNELGLVFEEHPSLVERPKIRVIADGNGLKNSYILDLSEKTADGRFTKNIVKRLDPNKYDINLAEYLM